MKNFITILLISFFPVSTLMCSDTGNDADLPVLSLSGTTQSRDLMQNTLFRFSVEADRTSGKEIRVKYQTSDETAKSGMDYLAASGTVVIPAGQSSAYIEVTVRPDTLRQADLIFTVELTTAENGKVGAMSKAFGTIVCNGTWLPVDGSGYVAPVSYQGMNLVWSEEFNGKQLNTSAWTHETGGTGWGNNELQNYTTSTKNSFLSGGYLVIEARKEQMGNNNYTSARIISKDKKTFTYGRMDIRAKLPRGKGIWPALWMLGNNISQVGWPACGEIDIMEYLGHETNKVYGTLHWGPKWDIHYSKGGNTTLAAGHFDESFHVFSLLWETGKLTVYLDNVPYFSLAKDQINGGEYPFDKPHFFIMNLAVGGNWPGSPDANTTFPQRMIVDYIRVYQ